MRDLDRAREALRTAWPFLREESDVSEDLRAKATELEDLLARETFYRELPAIDQHASAIDAEYARRFDEALEARIAAYTQALDRLAHTPGWDGVDKDQQQKLAAPFERGKTRDQEQCQFLSSVGAGCLRDPSSRRHRGAPSHHRRRPCRDGEAWGLFFGRS